MEHCHQTQSSRLRKTEPSQARMFCGLGETSGLKWFYLGCAITFGSYCICVCQKDTWSGRTKAGGNYMPMPLAVVRRG